MKDNKKKRELYTYRPVDVETVEFTKLLILIIELAYPHLALMWKAHLIAGHVGFATDDLEQDRSDQSASSQSSPASSHPIPPWHGRGWFQDVEQPATSHDLDRLGV